MATVGTLQDFHNTITNLKLLKCDFVAKAGNFSGEIYYEGKSFFYTNSERSFAVHHAVKSMKKDLFEHLNEKCFTEVRRNELSYFFKKNGLESVEGEFYNLDLKRAYPQSLYNTNFLSEKTKEKLESLKKTDKLAVCGMLAYNPDFFYFENGKLIGTKKLNDFGETIDFSSCFFFCVKKVQDLMLEIIEKTKGDYFFTWVDGIFFRRNDNLKNKIEDIIIKNGYNFSFDICRDLKVDIKEHTLLVTYKKGADEMVKKNGLEINKSEKILHFPSQYALSKKKYEIFHKISKEQTEDEYVKMLSENFMLDSKGQIIF